MRGDLILHAVLHHDTIGLGEKYILASEGLPFVIDHYRTEEGGTSQIRTREYPIGDIAVEFGIDTAMPSE